MTDAVSIGNFPSKKTHVESILILTNHWVVPENIHTPMEEFTIRVTYLVQAGVQTDWHTVQIQIIAKFEFKR